MRFPREEKVFEGGAKASIPMAKDVQASWILVSVKICGVDGVSGKGGGLRRGEGRVDTKMRRRVYVTRVVGIL